MKISLSPRASEAALTVVKAGDILTINGEAYDFSSLPDGATIPEDDIPCPWIVGEVHRTETEIEITLLLPIPTTAEQWLAFPEPLVDVPDGPVDLPTRTVYTTEELPAEGGRSYVTTAHRWHQPDLVETRFIPEEMTNVEA
jgi:hypothetical protein